MKKMTTRWFRLILLIVGASSLGYMRYPALAGSALPKIETFRVSSPVITSGEAVTLRWTLANSDPAQLFSAGAEATYAGADYAGATAELKPALSVDYTLVAQNHLGSTQQTRRVEVRGVKVASVSGGQTPDSSSGGAAANGAGGSERGAGAPEGTLGVSLNPGGPFVNDEAGSVTSRADKRVLRVPPGSEFFLELSFSDPDGIASLSPLLVNGRPEGFAGTLSPDRPPFSVVGAPTGDCRLGLLPTTVRCIFRIRVADDARNISELPGAGEEFAYVFRARVIDELGNSANREVRGYVVVTAP